MTQIISLVRRSERRCGKSEARSGNACDDMTKGMAEMRCVKARMTSAGFSLAIGLLGFAGAASAAELFVSGVHPDRRPEGAPTITEMKKDAAWEAKYLFGVTPPAPTTLGLKDQGAWYTPFSRRGMHPPYDPRGWWSASAEAPKAPAKAAPAKK
jgi:hypothetical protein